MQAVNPSPQAPIPSGQDHPALRYGRGRLGVSLYGEVPPLPSRLFIQAVIVMAVPVADDHSAIRYGRTAVNGELAGGLGEAPDHRAVRGVKAVAPVRGEEDPSPAVDRGESEGIVSGGVEGEAPEQLSRLPIQTGQLVNAIYE